MGFGLPISSWLRGPLKNWCEDLINETKIRNDGFFSVDIVRKKWEEHLSENRNWQYQLWNICMFQQWLENN